MSERIFEEELERESVFRDASKLSPDYVPEVLVHRDEEFRKLTQIFKPVIESQASQRVLITGSTGVGKTVLARRFGAVLEATAKGRKLDIRYLHVNCRKDKTPYSVLAKIYQYLNPRWPYHGLGPEKLLDTAVTYLGAHDAYLVLTLDELDYFVQLNGPDLVYSLTRAAEETGGPNRISIVAIARDKSFLRALDAATQSTFMHNVLPLDCYTAPQLADILRQRVGEAFKTGAVEEETVELIADIASRWGDARLALELLWRAGTIADGEGKDVVMPEHARQAKAEVYPEVKREVLRDLQLHEKLVLLAAARRLRVSKRAYAMTGDIEKSYRVVCEEYGEEPFAHTQFWDHLKRLDGLGLVDLQPSGPGHRGHSLKVSIQEAPAEWIEREVEKLLERGK
ncbi:MAG: ORC1-type DNA replication protein [Candidatus Hodarchaeaceae archaeon]|nr:ORC1-type DNA replication protein [Candidatus Hodarchaeaceae archaeon]